MSWTCAARNRSSEDPPMCKPCPRAPVNLLSGLYTPRERGGAEGTGTYEGCPTGVGAPYGCASPNEERGPRRPPLGDHKGRPYRGDGFPLSRERRGVGGSRKAPQGAPARPLGACPLSVSPRGERSKVLRQRGGGGRGRLSRAGVHRTIGGVGAGPRSRAGVLPSP